MKKQSKSYSTDVIIDFVDYTNQKPPTMGLVVSLTTEQVILFYKYLDKIGHLTATGRDYLKHLKQQSHDQAEKEN